MRSLPHHPMADVLLSEQQRNFFHTFGYLAFPGLM
jgi:hypothetical protein